MTRRSFVVRIWLDEEGAISGQISDPLTDWRQAFQAPAELWTLMSNFLTELPAVISPDFHGSLLEVENVTKLSTGDADGGKHERNYL